MKDEKRKGILSKLFGAKESGCCNVKIEEVTEEQTKDAGQGASPQPSGPSAQPSCCCGGRPAKRSGK